MSGVDARRVEEKLAYIAEQVADLRRLAAETTVEAFAQDRCGVFTAEEAEVFRHMIGFRNRLVHGYDRVDDARVYEVLQHRLADFDRFQDTVRRFLQGAVP